jgi:uncharacterized protein YbjT (DUF2867 family)
VILVTGATGTVGREVVRELRAHDEPVRAASRDAERTRERHGDDATWVSFDFTRPETYYPALEGVDAVFLVRPPAVSRVGRDIVPFLDSAARMGVGHVTFLSVLGAEKNPLLPHRRIERHLSALAAEGAVTYTFLRASFFVQNLLTEHRRDVVDNDRLFLPAGDGATSFVDARDVAAVGAVTLVETGHENRAYDLTGPAALTYHDVADVLTAELGREIRYVDPSIPRFAATMYRRGRPLPFVLVMVGLYTVARLGFAGRVNDDIRRVLGRDARSLRTVVRDNRAAFGADDGSRDE